jgi:hypothetical protein
VLHQRNDRGRRDQRQVGLRDRHGAQRRRRHGRQGRLHGPGSVLQHRAHRIERRQRGAHRLHPEGGQHEHRRTVRFDRAARGVGGPAPLPAARGRSPISTALASSAAAARNTSSRTTSGDRPPARPLPTGRGRTSR